MGVKFSICLIVKNGEKTLPALFESLKPFLKRDGDVCVLDTGSKDNSVQIAWDAGCSVRKVGSKYVKNISAGEALAVNMKFVVEGEEPILKGGDTYFHFAEARNEAASMAKNDRILFLDADEVVSVMDIDAIEREIDNGYFQFKYQLVFSHDADGKEDSKFLQSKFYDRRVLKWENIIHEMLVGGGQAHKLDESILKIEHFQNHESDRSGYLRGLAIDCFEHPEKDRNCHYFGRELFYSGRGKSAMKEFERHLAMTLPPKEYDTTPTHMESMMYLGNIHGLTGNLAAEHDWYMKAMENEPLHRHPVIRLAQFYKWHGDRDRALLFANRASGFPWEEKYGCSKEKFDAEVQEIQKWAASRIPKRIISMWIGGEMPDVAKECVATHKLPGYEHMWIDNSNMLEFDCPYLQECLSSKRFGKASDFIRMKCLEKYGGIYLDADTKILKPFDDVLDHEIFVCVEKNIFIANGIVGAVPGHPMITEYLRRLTTNFRGDGDMVFQPGMALWTDLILYGEWVNKVKVYPNDWFLPFDWQTGEIKITENTHTMHYYLQSWKNQNEHR